ncbi:MAG: hypothetical protein NDI60_10065 [Elusimicrobiales bacterium]|nr:hypothetical protein [Elusimicrobiales bacterium]
MEEIEKDRAAIGWFPAAWDDYVSALPRLLPVLLLQTAITAGGLPLIKTWHSLLPSALYSVFITTPVATGSCLVYVTIARGGQASLRDLFSAFPVYPRALAVSLGLGLLTLGGLLAFVIPGAILYLTYCFSEYLVVDRRTGVRESFAISRALTEGWKLRLLPIALLLLAISLLAPEVARITGPLKTPEVTLDFRPWTVVSYLLKNLVFIPWLSLVMARAYVFLLSAPAFGAAQDSADD